MALTATDANRFVLRIARYLTGRPKILVFDWCYHGTVDETFATMGPDGEPSCGNPTSARRCIPGTTTKVVEFNDLAGLEAALAPGDVACVLAEPALTNIGIVLPDPGYHEALREICTRTGTLLVIDETHTICAGPGGATAAWGLEPDMLTIGKPIAGGIPAAAYGMTAEVGAKLEEFFNSEGVDVSGIGGTLAGNALSVAAIRATLGNALRETRLRHRHPPGRTLDGRRRRGDRRSAACPGRCSASAAAASTGSATRPATAPRPRPPSTPSWSTGSTCSC